MIEKPLCKTKRSAGFDEMARDEARHGHGFEGLLKRYFGKYSSLKEAFLRGSGNKTASSFSYKICEAEKRGSFLCHWATPE